MKITLAATLFAALWLLHTPAPLSAAGRGEKQAIQKLTSEILILQRQVRDLQESITKSNGELTALVSQIGDNVARASHALTDTQTRMQDVQTRVTTALNTMDTRLLKLDSNFQVVNERLVEALDRMGAVKQELAALREKAVLTVDPTDPVQVFSAAYGDYLKGNYQLAIDQFRQFLLKFPRSEQADDAQYWIGVSYFNQGMYDQAIEEFNSLQATYPSGDKVPAARLKKGLALLALDQTNQGIKELRQVLKQYPDSSAAAAAKQRLQELGVPLTQPRKSTRRRRRSRKH